MRFRLWPASLAGRTRASLLIGLAVVQVTGFLVHASNQRELARIALQRDVTTHEAILYRRMALTAPDKRAILLSQIDLPDGESAVITNKPANDIGFPLPLDMRQVMRGAFIAFPMPPRARPHGITLRAAPDPPRFITSFLLPPQLPDENSGMPMRPPPLPPPGTPGQWLVITTIIHPPPLFQSFGIFSAFAVMTLLGVALILWAVRQLAAPVRTLADAAERLGRDVLNAPSLPETGPSEIVTAAIAFNTMASRIRRFVEDRTFLLTAIGHDLRTPITRLKLRAEFLEDDEQRGKFLADLDELEAMVAATLAFGRDVTTSEAVTPIDLASLLRTILDEAIDSHPALADAMRFEGPEHMTVRGRPLALKRAFANLILNAVKYGDSAKVTLSTPRDGMLRIDIDDTGPGIPQGELERVFEPFRRIETSRNRETGGSGLGLAIARNAIRAQGGDIALSNRPEGGLRAAVTLPV